MSVTESVSKSLLLPELKLISKWCPNRYRTYFKAEKTSSFEVCPKCATKSHAVHDRRWVEIKDSPIRHSRVKLWIRKRRFQCKSCRSVFTEPVPGIMKGHKTTERLKRGIRWACERFSDFKKVQATYNVSAGFVYKAYYQMLERKVRQLQYPWPKTIGIDEHSFKRNRRKGHTEYATLIVDYTNDRVFEVAHGRSANDLDLQLFHIPGQENVQNVVLDMCDPFKKWAQKNFPNANLVADHFHVVRLFNPAINRYRKTITGDQRKHPIRKLLLCNGYKLDDWHYHMIKDWLRDYPALKELYEFKERLHMLYRCKGYHVAKQSLQNLLDDMACSEVPEVQSIRKTLRKWRQEILNYFTTKLTNAKTEGYNNLSKLRQHCSFGVRNFGNYRLKLLNL